MPVVVASTARVSIKGRESWPGLKSHGSNVCTLYRRGNLGHKPGFYATWIPPSLFMTALSSPFSRSLTENFTLNCNSLSLSLASRQPPRFAKLFHRFSSFVGQRAFYELCKILPGDIHDIHIAICPYFLRCWR